MSTPLTGFPRRYEGLPEPTGEQWHEAAAKAYKELRKGGIVALYGLRGTGKTRMAYELAKEPGYPDPAYPSDPGDSVRLRPAIYMTAMMLFLEIRDTFRPRSTRSELQLMRELADAVLLVIDETQERGETKFEDQKLTAIIDARYQRGRPTLILSNYTNEEFARSVSPSVLSRIQECGGGICFDWKSYRTVQQ